MNVGAGLVPARQRNDYEFAENSANMLRFAAGRHKAGPYVRICLPDKKKFTESHTPSGDQRPVGQALRV